MQSRITFAVRSNWEAALDEVLDLGQTSRASGGQYYEILTRRHGLVSGKVETLESIGDDHGITKERVRQLEAKAMSRIRRCVNNHHNYSLRSYRELVSTIQREVTERGGALSKDEVLTVLGQAVETTRYNPEMSVAFFLGISDLYLRPVKNAEDQWVVYGSKSVAARSQQVIGLVHGFLQENGPVEEWYLLDHLADPEMSPTMVEAAVRTDRDVRVTGGYIWLIDSPKWHYVLASVRQLGRSAHFSEITNRVNMLLPKDCRMSKRAVHAMLGNHEPRVFRRVGLGTFGLAEWGLPAVKDSVDLVCQILERDITWLTFQEIVSRAKSAGWRVKPESIKAALDLETERANRRVRKVGLGELGRFGLSGWNAS